MELLLVHSPLVGPATWRWVASALEAGGHRVVCPDLRSAAEDGTPLVVVDAAVAALPPGWSAPIVVGHSGAGFLLPSIAERAVASHAVFVDAGLPPDARAACPGADMVEHLRTLAVGGRLPKWSTWWGPEVMRTLVPDDRRRLEVEAELPQVPLSFYETTLALPGGWQQRSSSYLLLSDAYRADAEKARSLGWRLVDRVGGHLDIVNEPQAIADCLVDLARGAAA